MKIPIDLIKYLRKSTRVAILTGAGISAESGLRTFREAQTGYWSQYRPEDLATPHAFARDPKLVWDWYAMRRAKVAAANPNAGHDALVDMESHIPDFTLITQNVDGYHKMAGSKNVLELHGNIQQVRCYDGCGIVDDWEEPTPPPNLPHQQGMNSSPPAERGELEGSKGGVPRCKKCDAYLRPDVVWFTESLPLDALNAAIDAANHCQVFFSIGTSALVHPAASLPAQALSQGIPTVEINPESTHLTQAVTFAINGPAGEVLPQLVALTWPD